MTSYAKTVSASPVNADTPRPAFEKAGRDSGGNQEARPSRMVSNEQPVPAPRPSPDMAAETDRAAFNERWDKECDSARKQRKSAFKEKRKTAQARIQSRAKSFNRKVTR